MPILARFNEIITGKYPFLKDAELFVAVSGGKDSMTLSHLLKSSGMDHTVLHCNFNLRGTESEQDERFVRDYSKNQGLDFKCKKFDTEKYAEKEGLSIQEAARNLRYDWFKTFLDDKNSYLLTAHHLDDSIETFFINLLRGTGYKGLAGIPDIRENIVRPLSSFKVEDIVEYVRENDLEYRHDSSNDSDKYLRNKIRHHLMPELLDLEPSFKRKMRSFFDEMQGLKNMLGADVIEFTERHFEVDGDVYRIPLDVLQSMTYRHQFIAIFGDFGIRPNNVEQLMEIVSDAKTGKKFYSNSHIFLIDREALLIRKDEHFQRVQYNVSKFPIELQTGSGSLSITESNSLSLEGAPEILKLDRDKVKLPLTVRNWKEGDRIQPLGMKGSKLISDVLIDKKVDLLSKKNVLIIEDSDKNILCIPGLMISETVKLEKGSKGGLVVSIG